MANRFVVPMLQPLRGRFMSLPTSRDIARIALLPDQGLSEEGRESSGWWFQPTPPKNDGLRQLG